MLSFILTDIQGTEHILSEPLSITLNRDITAPADSLTALFVSDEGETEFSDIAVYDGKKCVFRGIVDEQTETFSANGRLLEINARSLAALLLDNEAMPQSWYLPNMRLFMERNFSKLGFTQYVGEDAPKSGSMSIDKGTSEWSVLEHYCENFLGTYPSIDENGVINISGTEPELTVITGDGDIRILSLKRTRKRCGVISEYRVRSNRFGSYEMLIGNDNADRLKITSVRYVNTIDNKSAGIESCYRNIENSNSEYETIDITVSGRLLVRAGDYVVISGYDLGNMRVRSLRYELDGQKETTRLIMNTEGGGLNVDSREYGKK